MDNAALVLEGGGMRGVFTAGVLEAFLRHGVYFNYVAATSAGASNGLSYASRQMGRAHFCNIEALGLHKYIGLKFLFTQRCIMDFKYLFEELPLRVYPYDMQSYLSSGRFILTATDTRTGLAHYFDTPRDMRGLLLACRASCSMPLVCPMVKIGESEYLDGGIVDAIPYARAAADGRERRVIVLTRLFGYRKKPEWKYLSWIYAKYPNLRRALVEKSAMYNRQISAVEQMQKRGEVFVIRPSHISASRLSADRASLEELYNHGVEVGEASLDGLEKFLA